MREQNPVLISRVHEAGNPAGWPQKQQQGRLQKDDVWNAASWRFKEKNENAASIGGSSISKSVGIIIIIEKCIELGLDIKNMQFEALCVYLSGDWKSLEPVTELLQSLLAVSDMGMSKQRMILVARLRQPGAARSADSSGQTGRCKVLRYYNNNSNTPSGSRASSVAQTLDFRNQHWDTSGMPATIPQELWDMRREDNRWKSFHLPDASFTAASLVSVRDLVADGFYYMQESDRVKCAFCKGVLKDWEPGEQVREAHRRHFSTCPFVLFVEVGNVPREDRDADVRSTPKQCTEEATDGAVMVSGDWSAKLIADLPPIEASGMSALAFASDAQSRRHRELTSANDGLLCLDLLTRPQLPVSMDAARSACSDKALMNLPALQLRFESERSSVTAAHPEFANYSARLKSLHSALVQQPGYLLAKAGFFYMSDQRVTCCFSCGLHVRHWTCDDDVWVLHARWSPRCPHVLLERGCEFVTSVHRVLPPVLPVVSRSLSRPQPSASSTVQIDAAVAISAAAAVVADSRFSASSVRAAPTDEALAMTPGVEFRVEARDIKARADLPSVRLMTQLGFSALQSRLFTELHLRRSGDDFASSELFLDFMFTESRQMRELSLDPESFFQSRMAEIRRYLDQPPKPREVIDWRTCRVCMDKEVNILLLDCGHVACCSVCAKSLKTCPICRAFIRGTLVLPP